MIAQAGSLCHLIPTRAAVLHVFLGSDVGNLQDLIQFIFAGLTGGAIYALVALGFGVVHNTMGIVNFTQVDFVSLGGMMLYSALFAAGLPMPVVVE